MKCALSVLTLVVASALPLAARAQAAWPSHTVRIIATSPPGGSVDFLSRALAEDFSKTFGAPFVVESRPGANGNIGVDLVVKAPADGHMLFVAPPGPFAINAHLMDFMPFNPATDIAPVAMLGVAPLLLVVHPSVPAKDLRELLAWLRGEGAHAHYASQAVASTGHLAMELLKSRALAHAQVARRMRNLGIEARPMTPEQFGEFLSADTEKWADIIRRSGAKVE